MLFVLIPCVTDRLGKQMSTNNPPVMSVWWGILLIGLGAYVIVYLAVTEENLAWILPTGVVGALIMLAGVSLLIRKSQQKATRTLGTRVTMTTFRLAQFAASVAGGWLAGRFGASLVWDFIYSIGARVIEDETYSRLHDSVTGWGGIAGVSVA